MRAALSRLKYTLARPLPPKAYWFLMGTVKPVTAVTSECGTLAESLASGREVVALLDGLGVIHAGAVTLQIGSGLGRVEHHLAPRVGRCVGIDISPSMVTKARRAVTHANVEFLCTDGRSLPDPGPVKFDLIYSFLVFQHLPRPQFHRYVDEAFTALAEGGHLVFHIKVDEADHHPDPPAHHPYGLRYYRRADVSRTLRAAGFEEIGRVGLDGRPDDPQGPAEDVVFCARRPA